MLLTKIVFTIICVAVLIVLARLSYYVLCDKGFAKNNTRLVQCSAAVVTGSFTGGLLRFIYDMMVRLWFS